MTKIRNLARKQLSDAAQTDPNVILGLAVKSKTSPNTVRRYLMTREPLTEASERRIDEALSENGLRTLAAADKLRRLLTDEDWESMRERRMSSLR